MKEEAYDLSWLVMPATPLSRALVNSRRRQRVARARFNKSDVLMTDSVSTFLQHCRAFEIDAREAALSLLSSASINLYIEKLGERIYLFLKINLFFSRLSFSKIGLLAGSAHQYSEKASHNIEKSYNFEAKAISTQYSAGRIAAEIVNFWAVEARDHRYIRESRLLCALYRHFTRRMRANRRRYKLPRQSSYNCVLPERE